MKTYDLSDEMAAEIRAAGIDLPEAVCDSDERLVHSVESFREAFESSRGESDLLALLTDEEIGHYVPDPYEEWHRDCESSFAELQAIAARKGWTLSEVALGDGELLVPAAGPRENLNAMLTEIPTNDGEDPFDEDSDFNLHVRAFLLQDGNLAIPGSRYGRRISDVIDLAIAHALTVSYHQGERPTYHSLNHTVGMIVNDHSEIESDLREYGAWLSDAYDKTADDLLDY